VRTRDRLRFRPAIALELGSDAGKADRRPIVIHREPDDVLFLAEVRLRRVFGKTIERAPGSSLPASASRCSEDVLRMLVTVVACPSHHDEFALNVGVARAWRGVIWKHARHRRQVADKAVHDSNEGGDRAMIGGAVSVM
jgi:hypothetical protein